MQQSIQTRQRGSELSDTPSLPRLGAIFLRVLAASPFGTVLAVAALIMIDRRESSARRHERELRG